MVRLTFATAPTNIEADNRNLAELTEKGTLTIWVGALQAASLLRLAEENYAEKETVVEGGATCFKFTRTSKAVVPFAEGRAA